MNDIVASSNNVIVQANDISVGNGSVNSVEQSPVLMISEQKDATSTSEGNILHIISTDPDQKSLEDDTDGKSFWKINFST